MGRTRQYAGRVNVIKRIKLGDRWPFATHWHCSRGCFATERSPTTEHLRVSRSWPVYRRCVLIPGAGNVSASTGREIPALQPDILIMFLGRELPATLFRPSAVENVVEKRQSDSRIDLKRRNEHSSEFSMENTTGGT